MRQYFVWTKPGLKYSAMESVTWWKKWKSGENNEQNPAAPTPAKQETVQFFQKTLSLLFGFFTKVISTTALSLLCNLLR